MSGDINPTLGQSYGPEGYRCMNCNERTTHPNGGWCPSCETRLTECPRCGEVCRAGTPLRCGYCGLGLFS